MVTRHLVLSPSRPSRVDPTRRVDPIELLQASLGTSYQVEREIGHGGMGRVYLARDVRHHRPVAIKVLHPEIANALGPDRFLREIAIAATFVHPSVLPLYDSGSAEGVLYYVMPYVDGESLRARLSREGQLGIEEVVRITGDVASALDYAHARGVVHRDVKPENILLTSGRALLTDFGLAMSVDGMRGTRTTLSGHIIGTPSYMSPEQGAPGGQVDGRADIYALGCVVYEMLAGEAPFAGATDRAILARHAVDPVPPLRTIRPGLPGELEQAVLRALAKVPADRPAEAGRFAASLVAAPSISVSRPRRPTGTVGRLLPLIGLLLVAVLPLALEQRAGAAHAASAVAPASRPQLSVGTFINRTGDPTLDRLGSVVTPWLTWGLAGSGTVNVVDSSALEGRGAVARGRPNGVRPAGPVAPQLLVTGNYYRLDDGIILHATVTELRSSRVVFAADPVLVDPQNPGSALGRLQNDLVMGISAAISRGR
jgi:serine/threonine-protein kinase